MTPKPANGFSVILAETTWWPPCLLASTRPCRGRPAVHTASLSSLTMDMVRARFDFFHFFSLILHTLFWNQGWTIRHVEAKLQKHGCWPLSPGSAITNKQRKSRVPSNTFQDRTMAIQHQHVNTLGFIFLFFFFFSWEGFTDNYYFPSVIFWLFHMLCKNPSIVFALAEGTRHQTLNFPLSHLVGLLSVPFLGQGRQLLSAKHSVFLYQLKKNASGKRKKWKKISRSCKRLFQTTDVIDKSRWEGYERNKE